MLRIGYRKIEFRLRTCVNVALRMRSLPCKRASRAHRTRLPRPSGNRELHRRADVQGAANLEPAAVCLHDVLDDREAETGAAELARARFVDAVEALRQPRQVGRRDTDAVVLDADLYRRRRAIRSGGGADP